MADILLYIKPKQVSGVFEKGDVGSGQTRFGGLSREGGRVFVASDAERGPAIFGEIPIDEPYEDRERPDGWKYRVRATRRSPCRYEAPVDLVATKSRFEFLEGADSVKAAIHRCRRLAPADAKLISSLGRAEEQVGSQREPDVRRVLLDEALHGMADFLRDAGWEPVLLPSGAKDDAVFDRARAEGHIVVTGDEKLLERCRRRGLEVIDVGFKGQLDLVERALKEKFRPAA